MADTVTVDIGGSGDYTSIQDAIDNASPGDSIVVLPGTYNENLIVDKSVSIQSESRNPEDTIIMSASSGDDVIHVTADNITISGFNITTSSVFFESIDDDDPTIYYYSGIFLDRVKGSVIKDNTISYNCRGVYIDSSNDNTLENNEVFSNNVGLYILSSDRNSLINNKVTSEFTGIYLDMAWDNSLISNTIYSCSNNGISISDSFNATVTGNDISFCDNGIRIRSGTDNSVFAENTVSLNNYGFNLYFAANVLITDNVISENNLYGFYAWDANDNTIKNNIISNNTNAGMFLEHYSEDNLIYNNYFSNSDIILTDSLNRWNISKTEGTNIVGGPYIGGNFWASPDGTGFSQFCEDADKDGLCDESFTIQVSNIDYLPLCTYYDSNVIVDCNGNGDFTSIQDAINNIDAGGHILVLPGIYTENLIVDKPVSIISESGNPENTIIMSDVEGTDVIHITADNVTISGFYITSSGTFDPENLDDYCHGIRLVSVQNALIENNILYRNFVGVGIQDSSNNIIRNNSVVLNKRCGLAMYESENNNLSFNTISSTLHGISIEEGLYNSFVSNSIDSCDIGILLTGYENTLTNNTVVLNNWGIRISYSDFNVLSDNIVSDNSEYGFLITTSGDNTINGNFVCNNSECGIYTSSSSRNTFYNNYLNNSNNVEDYSANNWNIARTAGTNIVGGQYLGGNFWANPDNTGFSQTHVDLNENGICDDAYRVGWYSSDNFPLYSEEYFNSDAAEDVTPSAANTKLVDSLEIRSPVYDSEDIALLGDGESYIEINALNFAGFYYDFDSNLSTESMRIYDFTNEGDGKWQIKTNGLQYTTTIQQVPYRADFAEEDTSINSQTYPVLGVLGTRHFSIGSKSVEPELFVPISDQNPGLLGELLVDSNQKYIIKEDSSLELPNGYELTALQVDTEDKKVWLTLSKDGKWLCDEVISVENENTTWDYKVTVEDDEVLVFRLLVTDVFSEQGDNFVAVEGIWLIQHEYWWQIEEGDEFGNLEVGKVGTDFIMMYNPEPINLSAGSETSIGWDFAFSTAYSTEPFFCLKKDIKSPGTYEVRSTIVTGPFSGYHETRWDYSNFAGFVYDIDDNKGTEIISVYAYDSSNGVVIELDSLIYCTSIVQKEYAADFDPEGVISTNSDTYSLVGLFGEKYVSVKDSGPDELAALIIDTGDEHILTEGSSLELPQGFELTVRSIDVINNAAIMELSRGETLLFSENVDPSENKGTWDYKIDIGSTEDVIVFRTNLKEIYQNESENYIVLEGLWLIDYKNVLEINSGDVYGGLVVDTVGDSICMVNYCPISLEKGQDFEIAEGFKLKTADDEALRFYLFREYEVIDNNTGNDDENQKPVVSSINLSSYNASSGTEVTFSGSGTDSDGSIVAYSWRSDIDGQLSMDASFTSSALSSGNHTIYFKVQDDDGAWSDEASAGIIIEAASSIPSTSGASSSGSSSGGGGGGGGGTTGEKYENIAFKDVMSEFVRKDAVTSYEFDDEDNVVEYVRFTASRNWGKISTTIECLHGTSALVDISPEGAVYRNVNIWLGKSGFSDPENIKDCVIGFKVSSSWLQENDIDQDSIRLLHYTGGKWEELATSLVGESDGYLHFEAKTSGFSPFAITADRNKEIVDDKETMMSIASASEEPLSSIENAPETQSKTTPGFEFIVSDLAVLLTGYFMFNRKQR